MILLDTHVWIWWVSGFESLPRKVTTALNRTRKEGTVRISSISVWEVAQLVAEGRLELTMDVDDFVATALSLGATLVTKDARLRRYAHVDTLW